MAIVWYTIERSECDNDEKFFIGVTKSQWKNHLYNHKLIFFLKGTLGEKPMTGKSPDIKTAPKRKMVTRMENVPRRKTCV